MRPDRALPFAERMNAVTNLMDILPVELDETLLPVGFAEGRCDIFRVEAMRAAGMYQPSYRTAGEDQALAARMRQHGYSLYQAPAAIYFLSVSREQDTLAKLIRHAWLFGKMHPLLLLGDPGTREGVIGAAAGRNRRARAMLRALQIISVVGYAVAIVSPLFRIPLFAVGVLLAAIVAAKLLLFYRHIARVGFSAVEWIALLAFQPVLDVAYVVGLCQGAVLLARGWRRTRSAV
jgi:GT2 family glycosyltransferase